MDVTIIGTGTTVPSLERRGASVLARTAGRVIVFDLGLGSLHGLLKAGVAHRDIDFLVFTHLHPDHVTELLPFLFASNYDPSPRARPLAIAGSAAIGGLLEGLGGIFGRWVGARGYERRFVELMPGGVLELDGARLSAGPANHDASSLSYRLEADSGTLVITGDTGPSEELSAFARGADAIVAEASLAEGETAEGHMTAREAGFLARSAGAGRLVLTHFYPSSDADSPEERAAGVFGGAVSKAFDGFGFTVPQLP